MGEPWKGPERCDTCGWELLTLSELTEEERSTARQKRREAHAARCYGELIPHDRRAPDPRVAAMVAQWRKEITGAPNGNTWPEQEAVSKWWEAHQYELKGTVTEERIRQMKRAEAAERRAAALVEAVEEALMHPDSGRYFETNIYHAADCKAVSDWKTKDNPCTCVWGRMRAALAALKEESRGS